MFEVTREMFHQEMAEAVFAHLRDFLLEKENNHCQRVEFLPVEVMRLICEQVSNDAALKKHGVEAFVLAENATNALEIETGALIEKRNREKFGVLVAFIPQGLRLPAEDSYDIQTFKTYDLSNVLRAHVRAMVEALPEGGSGIANKILTQASIRRLPVDQHIKYLLALKNDGAGWEEAGAYLFYLDLIPDLDLTENALETRLDRNSKCVLALTDESQSTLSSLDELADKLQLDTQANGLRENVVSFLRTRNVADTQAWLKEILADEAIRPKLNFAKWKFKDSPDEGNVEVHLNPLRDPKTDEIVDGFRNEGGNLIASTTTPIKLKWQTYPANAPSLGHFVVLIVRDSDDEAGAELSRKIVKNNKRTETRTKVSLKDIELTEGETCAAKVIVQARDRSGVVLSSDESEPFWIEGSNQEGADTGKKKVNKIRNRAEAFFISAHRARKKIEVDSEGWEEGTRPLLYRLKLKNRDIYHILLNPVLYGIELRNIDDPATCGTWEANLRDRGAIEPVDLRPVPVVVSSLTKFEAFIKTRKELFAKFQERDPNAVVEVLDLRDFKAEVTTYAQAYVAVLDEVRTKLKAATTDGQINNILNASHKLSRLVVAAISALSTAEAVALAKKAAELGCDGLMVLPPYVYEGNWREMKAHVAAVFAATPLSCMLYNNPVAYGTDFLPEQIRELAEEYDNLEAVKESSTDARRVSAIRVLLDRRLEISVGVDDAVLETIGVGATGWVAGLANALPRESVDLFNLGMNGQSENAFELYRWFLPLLRMDTVPNFVQLIKLVQTEAGMGNPRVRPPRLELIGDELEHNRQIIRHALQNRPQIVSSYALPDGK